MRAWAGGRHILHRRDFLAFGAMGVGGLMLPAAFGKVIAAEALDSAIDVAVKKQLADAAMNAAKSAGAVALAEAAKARLQKPNKDFSADFQHGD